MKRIVICLAVLLLPAASALGDIDEAVRSSGVKGGLVVHIGCGNGKLTASLRLGDSYLVHGLDVDAKNVEKARKHIGSLGLYGRVSVDTFDGAHLPYIDNMVNLVVVSGECQVAKEEILRVLAPSGVTLFLNRQSEIGNRKLVKPWPTNIDEWTHYLHGPDNNAVANDSVVGPPRRLQWQGGPKWTRHHDRMSSLSALVSSGGRLFYIMDEGSTASIFMPSHWALIARDAFNGTTLWKKKIDTWFTRHKGLKSGPADAPRRLVASAGRVYVTLSLDGPVTALDAVTGETICDYDGTEGAEEILLSDDVLFVLVGPGSLVDGRRSDRPAENRTIMALNASSGEKLWQTSDVVAAVTMAVDAGQLYYFNFDQKKAICLDRKTGDKVWTSDPLPTPERQTSFFASKLVVQDGVVLFASGEFSGMTKSGGGEKRSDTLTALSADSGETLWTAKHPPSGYSSPEDVFVIDGLVWCGETSNGSQPGMLTGRDLKTGAVKHEFPPDEQDYWFHHRCYSGRATCNYILTSRTGIEFVDFRKQHWDLNHWVRGACLYGIMPSGGLVYTPPAPCICYAEATLHSFNAFAPAGGAGPMATGEGERLEHGPAYAQIENRQSAIANPNDWPTYRCTNTRGGVSKTGVPTKLDTAWKTKLGGKLSSLIVADGKVFVAVVDRHSVHALDAGTGSELWYYTTGGRVDSPPTHFQGRVLFGSADGWVYCLSASDGKLIWRFRAAPVDRRLLSYEQIESVWPVHGNVLVHDGIAHFVAGRSVFVDGGMRLYRLDAKSGELISETVLDERNPKTGQNLQELVQWLNMAVGRPDILSCDGERIYMRSQAFDLEGRRLAMGPKTNGRQEATMQGVEGAHLFCPTGFLDDTWFHRTYWLYGTTWGSGWSGYYVAGKHAPAGKIMCVSEDTAYVFGRQPQYYKWTVPMEYRLFAAHKRWKAPATKGTKKKKRRGGSAPADNQENYRWIANVPILVRAMTLADKTLFIAGPRDVLDESTIGKEFDHQQKPFLKQEKAFEGTGGAALWAVSAEDGSKLAEYELDAPPIFDGLAAAGGRLYLTTTDGKVVCFGP